METLRKLLNNHEYEIFEIDTASNETRAYVTLHKELLPGITTTVNIIVCKEDLFNHIKFAFLPESYLSEDDASAFFKSIKDA